MAVFTPVTLDDLTSWLTQFPLGKPVAIKGIASGIENSNFFLTTQTGEYVLTIFKKLSIAQLPFYLNLMRHLAERSIQKPTPKTKTKNKKQTTQHNKPASIVT